MWTSGKQNQSAVIVIRWSTSVETLIHTGVLVSTIYLWLCQFQAHPSPRALDRYLEFFFPLRRRMPHHGAAGPYKNPQGENSANAPPLGYHESYINFVDAFLQNTDAQFFALPQGCPLRNTPWWGRTTCTLVEILCQGIEGRSTNRQNKF